MKRMMKVSIATLLLLAYSVVLMQSFAYSAITEEQMDAFLAEQGAPEIVIQKLPFDLKKRIYLGESTIEVGEPTYGVFTDDYRVEYKLENGQVVMDEQSRSQLKKLLSDEEAVANVLLSNEQAEAGKPVRLAANVKTEQDAINANKEDTRTYLMENREKIQSLKEMPEDAVLRTVKNWQSAIVCVQLSYSNSLVSKIFLFAWEWRNRPMNCLTDKAAIAWSGNFAGEPNSFAWNYQGYRMGPEEIHYEAEGVNYTDYEPNTGIGTDIDIKYKYGTFNIIRHVGLIGVKVTKRTTDNTRESAVGRYYHKYIALALNGALSFTTNGTQPSISISWNYAYDKAPDAGCTFDAIS